MRRALPHTIALLLGVLAALAVGCGSRSNLIPGGDATNLKAQLAQIKQDVEAGSCDGLEDRIRRVHDDAVALPSKVDKRLRSRINDGIQALENTAGTDCRAAKAAQTQTQTQTTETVPTDTQTQPTETTTTPTTPQPTTTEPPATTTEPPTTVTTPTTPSDTGTPAPPADNGGTPGGSVP